MVLWRLAISNFLVRKVRTALTVGAIALSAALVVTVTSGYKSMEASALQFMNRYMGTADAFVTPANEMQGLVPENLVDLVNQDPAVSLAIGRLNSNRAMPRAAPSRHAAPSEDRLEAGALPSDMTNVQLIGIRRSDDAKSESLEIEEGKWFDLTGGDVAVIDQIAASRLGLQIGDSLNVPGLRPLTLKVVGLVHKPTFFAERAPAIYLPLRTLQQFTGQDHPPVVSRITINLKSGADFNAFAQRWKAKLAGIDPNLHLEMRRDAPGELDKNLQAIHIVSYFGGCASMLTAMFITFSALSMGVTERHRTLAMLRAIGAVRGQVFRLVVMEGALLSIAGIILGTFLAMLCINLLYWRFSEWFAAGVVYSYGGMIFAAAGSLLTALAASILPAWSASRLSPVDAMNVQGSTAATGRPRLAAAAVGILLISIDPFLLFGPITHVLGTLGVADPNQTARTIRFLGHLAVGVEGIIFGFFLLAPLLIWSIEKCFARLVAALLYLPERLLRQQLSGGIWRAAGTAAALMVGLATLIAMQVQGHTLIGGWRLPDKFPDIFIYSPDPISWQDQKSLNSVSDIQPGSLMPVAIAAPTGDSETDLLSTAILGGRNGNFVFFGVDPDQAMNLVQLEFRDDDGRPLPDSEQRGAALQAAAELNKGRRIIVTEEFRQLRQVKIGDTLKLLTATHGFQNYTICAIVWSPGADLLVNLFDMDRMLDQQSAASVFGSLDDARRDFGVAGARLFAANLAGGVDKKDLLKHLQKSLGDRGLRAGDVRQIKFAVENAFYRLLMLISTVAFAALAVASLGVTNTVMASVRSRRWQFGVLRGIGASRGQLLRLVLAEAATLGLVGVALGLGAGLELAVDARKLSGIVMGYSPDLNIPWPIVGIGCLAVLLVALLASLWPAIGVARAEPLELLQAGRASM
ncbi:MAG: FtsX-like permease family protein [Tepidisphaeraceae bacterium]|jgi:putative ABC transport system permease protein